MNNSRSLVTKVVALAFFISFFLPLCSVAQQTAQGIQFFDGTMAQAIAKAKTENKCIFFDAYAS